jgi:chromosomal replication initiator protein
MKNLIANWEKTLELLKPELTAVSYDTWVYPLTPVKIDHKENRLYLSLYNDMAKSILEGRYISIIENAVKEAFGKKLKVIFIYTEDPQVNQDDINFTDELYLNPKYIFNTFVIGNNNRFAHAASLAVAESPSKAYNPLFIYGGAGLGKTHLMHAIGHYILQQNPKTKVLYVSSEMFTNELIKAIREDKNVEFRNKYRSIDVLLIDDIQFIEKKERTQEEIFHTFNTLYEANKQIIISSDRPPKEITTLEERLRSRFEWGLIADIQPPDYETRVAILRNKSELEGLDTTESLLEVIGVIAEKIHSNIRELEGAFIRVIAYANLTGQKINKELAKEVLKDVFSSKDRPITPALVKKYICKHFNIKQFDLESSKRSRDLAFPRQIAMFICRDMTELSLPKIGEAFGNRDHTTVLHACDKISGEIRSNESLREIIREIEKAIKED